MLSTTVVLRLIVLFVFHNPVANADTLITFPNFSPHDDFFTLGDVLYDRDHRSYIINANARTLASRGSCGVLIYGKKVHIQNVATRRVASFSSSFSFRFTTRGVPWDNMTNTLDGSGFGFTVLQYLPKAAMHDPFSQLIQFGACKAARIQNIRVSPPFFGVNIDTDYNPSRDEEPSNNYMRVFRNLEFEYDVEAYTHNLCGNDTHCSYFSNGSIFTAWIDFNSSSQTLEFRMAKGSTAKPGQPLWFISNYKFPEGVGDEVMLLFWGSSDVNHLEEHELLSWSFFSTKISKSTRESKLQLMLQYLKSKTWISGAILGILFGTVVASVILWFVFSFIPPSTNSTALGYSTGPRVFSYNELRKATNNFDERIVLGRGGSGVVYKGSLEGGGVLVAVKQINISEFTQAQALFHAEVASLGQIRHRNVVQLQGWCQEKGKLLLVYEYLSNGTLHDWLHKNSSQKILSVKLRHSILEGVGAAIKYLHEDCLSCILHRDIKSSNVLLDADFNAYLGDFGLARLLNHHKLEKTTLIAGTAGYMAPELLYTSKATKESDVYSFGILILEVVCGKHPLNLQSVEPEDLVLLFMVWRAYEGGSLFSMADPRMFETSQLSRRRKHCYDETSKIPSLLLDSFNLNHNTAPRSIVADVDLEIEIAIVVSFLQLGLFCCLPNPKARPSIGEVIRLLQQIRDIGNESPIATVLMPSLPSTKPLGVYHSLEFLHSFAVGTSSAPSPISLI